MAKEKMTYPAISVTRNPDSTWTAIVTDGPIFGMESLSVTAPNHRHALRRIKSAIKALDRANREKPRYCLWCTKELKLTVKESGKTEIWSQFIARKYCNFTCGTKGRIKRLKDSKYVFANGSLSERKCVVCEVFKPIEQFVTSKNGDTVYSYCKPCSKDYLRALVIMRHFSLTADDYDKILKYQNGGCAVCHRTPRDRRLAVDHDHSTGLIRGLLCPMCNRVSGLFGDGIERFKKLVEYLTYPPAAKALGGERYGRKGRRTATKAGKSRKSKFSLSDQPITTIKREMSYV